MIKLILDWFTVLPLERTAFERTLLSNFNDFEDGLQYFSASEVQGLNVIITRNKKDFEASLIPVFTATEYINNIKL